MTTVGEVIKGLCDKCHKIAKEHGFWDEERNDGELIALMHSELSEALEELRKPIIINKTDNKAYEVSEESIKLLKDVHTGRNRAVGLELADVMIRIFDYCGAKKIPLGALIIEKININEKRPFKHGKEF